MADEPGRQDEGLLHETARDMPELERAATCLAAGGLHARVFALVTGDGLGLKLEADQRDLLAEGVASAL